MTKMQKFFKALRNIYSISPANREHPKETCSIFPIHDSYLDTALVYSKNPQSMYMGSITFHIFSELYLSDFVLKNSLDLLGFFSCTWRATQPHIVLFKKKPQHQTPHNCSQGLDSISILNHCKLIYWQVNANQREHF